MKESKKRICAEVDTLAQELKDVNDYLFDNPEIGFKEHKACARLSTFLQAHGFSVKECAGGLDTALFARPQGIEPTRPAVAFISEYDALPEVGHGCGHNLIAAASLGAAVALSKAVPDLAGGIALVGTPAEEGGGGKVHLSRAGVFDDMDIAIMFHPGAQNLPGSDMLGGTKMKIEFFGKTSHASVAPDKGINALDALVMAYNAINSVRQHMLPTGRLHGIITNGGEASNIIPGYTSAIFVARATNLSYLEELVKRVENCVNGAALATGAKAKIEIVYSWDHFKHNYPLEEVVAENMKALGLEIDENDGRMGSSDISYLSFQLPCLHPFLTLDKDAVGHTVAFAEATRSPQGRKVLLDAAKMMAMIGYDYLTSENLRKQVVEDFNAHDLTSSFSGFNT